MDYKTKKKIIINYLLNYFTNFVGEVKFAVPHKLVSAHWAQTTYERLNDQERENIYLAFSAKQAKNRAKIIEYLEYRISSSLAMSEVNGSPEKRRMRIEEYARHKYDSMSERDKQAILNIINNIL
tara:strand:- start:2171 stop:2545 length:375 start_codon:yes stop_codon:yes gene_type:complete